MTKKKFALDVLPPEAGIALVWFGAGVSIAEILTGAYFAPLGFAKAVTAIIAGHIAGFALMFLAGYISAVRCKSAMETTKSSFGKAGGKFFAVLNVIQLAGWTSIMIFDGASCASQIGSVPRFVWAIGIGSLILLWIFLGVKDIKFLSAAALIALFALTIALSKKIFGISHVAVGSAGGAEGAMKFAQAFELSLAMPLSWLPLLGDYTQNARRPAVSSAVASAVYGATSIWMYAIGFGAAVFTKQSDIAQIVLKAGGVASLLIVILSTVTTTFLDAFSAGISAKAIAPSLNGKLFAAIVTLLGAACAAIFPMDDITPFLYFIGSVFAPMIAIMAADFFVLKADNSKKPLSVLHSVIWLCGFALCRALMAFDCPLGSTLPAMAFAFVATAIAGKVQNGIKKS